jgi:hypothetical protein
VAQTQEMWPWWLRHRRCGSSDTEDVVAHTQEMWCFRHSKCGDSDTGDMAAETEDVVA